MGFRDAQGGLGLRAVDWFQYWASFRSEQAFLSEFMKTATWESISSVFPALQELDLRRRLGFSENGHLPRYMASSGEDE